MYLVKTPRLLDYLYAKRTWRRKVDDRVVYLTFDDGPIPEITPWILDQLGQFEAKATFFCVGENVIRYPEIFSRIIKEGHGIGNHTHRHLNGSKTTYADYIRDVENCAGVLPSSLFRPPYGRLNKKKEAYLLEKGYEIIMWDVLSGDFDSNVDGPRCYENVVTNVQKGSIVVLHDNLKSIDTLKAALPKILDFLSREGYQMLGLPDKIR